MSTQNGKTDTSLASMRLVDLLDYVQHTVQLTERPVFSIRDHKNLLCFEHELQGRIGVLHDQQDENGASWLRIERLKRIDPPAVPEKIKVWVTVSRDPNSLPHVAESRIETLSEVDAKACLEQGVISKEDVSEVLKQSKVGSKQVDVFFRLERQPKLRVAIDTYIAEAWQRWADEERPRRETIRVYEQFFNLYHTIHSEGVEHPVEVVWGTGVALGKFDDRTIEQPLIEALVEMEIDEHSGAVCIRPREVPLQLGLSPFYAIDSPGAETVQRNAREFFAKLEREDREFSPFIRETFEPVLRGASQYLQESGVYHPDDIEDATDRTVPAMTSTLKITDTWAIYARRRVDNFIREDLERLKTAVRETKIGDIPASAQRFVTELSETKVINLPGDFRSGGFDQKEAGDDYEEEDLTNANDLYFPKEFNDAQLAITRRLEKSEGVVVQGPPGTGKTHTIANVICHYLATGRRVLVISKGEPALEVLREHIPEEIRDLSISLLASEREGLRQIETAVNRLASTVTSMNPRVVKRDISDKENQRRLLQEKINRIDVEMSEWARQHLSLVENTLVGDLRTLTPVELAERVITDRDLHAWFPDQVGSGLHSELRFTDEDIATVRVARKALGIDLEYNGHTLPSPNDFPDAATLEAIHSDLVNADRVQMEAVVENVPLIYLSVKHAPERAAETLKDLEVMAEYRRAVADQPWLESLFKKWHQTGFNHRSTEMFDNLIKDLAGITEQRKRFLKRPVGLPRLGPHQEAVREAVEKTAQGRRPFGLLPIGRANLRSLFDQITVDGHKPTTQDEWRHISSYLRYQVGITTFVARWNGIAGEFNLPTFSGDTGVTASILAGFHDLVEQAVTILKVLGPKIKQQLAVLFPRGLDASAIILDEAAAIGAAKALQLNLLRHQLSAAQGKVEQIRSRLHEYSGGIVTELEHFVNDVLGRSEVSVSEVSTRWNSLMSELQRLVSLRPHLEHVVHITSLVRESGAPQWAQALATVPVKEIDDPWTPAHWFESWLWTRQIAYLRQIDGRDRLRVLAEQRLGLDKELKRASADLVKLRTHLTLKANMSERVEGALQEFVTHIRKIGSGTGIRSFRHRRDARRAMEKCYAAVPCWIMPAWRASESLPATLGSFDLVIVDEASQSGIEALPALLRGKKLMIVGDDKQVSPTAAFIEEKKLLQLRHNFLNDQPYAALLLPGNSLYDLANAIFPGRRVMLQEHFRCVEPIIRFSFRFYTEPIVPLRIAKASERLDPPLIDVYVPHGSRGKEKINHAEAIAIIDEIERLVNDPAYKGRSIGCVSLIGGDQAQYMQKLLLERIGPAKFLEHRIACGDAPTFQGKERNIMFVSMVARSGHVSAQTSLLFQQRFNVALSRARDRMYLFRSVEEADLNAKDLKAQVIAHFREPMVGSEQRMEGIDRCESEFERKVFRRLVDLGYRVTPQVSAGPYRIDLVVEGTNDRRLAIELDGDRFHGPERWAEDLARQRVLERVGWRFWRCWASSFALEPEQCMQDLLGVLQSRGIEPIGYSERQSIYTEHRTLLLPSEQVRTASENGKSAVKPDKPNSDLFPATLTIEEGDRVTFSYGDEPTKQRSIIITPNRNDSTMIALLGHEVDDEIDIEESSGARTIIIQAIEKTTAKERKPTGAAVEEEMQILAKRATEVAKARGAGRPGQGSFTTVERGTMRKLLGPPSAAWPDRRLAEEFLLTIKSQADRRGNVPDGI